MLGADVGKVALEDASSPCTGVFSRAPTPPGNLIGAPGAAPEPQMRYTGTRGSGNAALRFMARLRAYKRALLLAGALLVLLMLGRFAPVGAWLEAGSRQMQSAGMVGAVLFVLAYTVGAFLFLPSAIFTCVAGYTYGAWWGALVAVPGVATSSFAMFLLARTFARKSVVEWVRQDPRILALDRLLGAFGPRVVVMLRLSPLSPFSVLNYAFGLTGIPKSHYLAASCIGAIPGSLFYAQLGAAAPHLGAIVAGRVPEGGGAQTIYLLIGLVATAAVGLWLAKLARDALASVPSSEPSAGSKLSD